MHGSPFTDIRVSTSLLAKALLYVSRQSWCESVSASDLIANVPGIGRTQAQHILDSLRWAESKTAQKRQQGIVLSHEIEGDATGVRSIVIKRDNPNFVAQVQAYEKKN